MKLQTLALFLSLFVAGCGGGGSPGTQAPAVASVASQAMQFLTVPPNTEGWTQEPAPVLLPSQPWEFTPASPQGNVLEPSVLFDSATGTYTMWYTGGWESCATGTATSTDGVNWTKNPTNPLIGQGKLGQAMACRNNVVKDPVSGEVYVYFSNSTGVTPGTIYVTHSADGVTNLAAPQLFLAPGVADWSLANSWVTIGSDGTWHFFYDSMTTTAWETFYAKCAGPLGPCVKQPGPLKGLQNGTGSYGGGWVHMQNGRFDTYYLAGPNGTEGGHLPTYVYHACDAGTGAVAFGNQGHPLFGIPAGYDQHGDPFVIDGVNLPDGKSRIWYDELYNPTGYSQIILATKPGALSTTCP